MAAVQQAGCWPSHEFSKKLPYRSCKKSMWITFSTSLSPLLCLMQLMGLSLVFKATCKSVV